MRLDKTKESERRWEPRGKEKGKSEIGNARL